MSEVRKGAKVEAQTVSGEDLALINCQSLKALDADEVFTFKLAACDNQIDRDHERFTDQTLEKLSTLFVGRTVVCDHTWSSSKQTARVYGGAVEDVGSGVKRLVLRCYMLRNEHTQPVIAAIEGGIMRECSVGCAVGKALCSVCGTDKARKRCGHTPGVAYKGQNCHVDLDGAEDAYEVSFVAVPAQPAAGVVKSYGGEHFTEDPPEDGSALRTRLLHARIELLSKAAHQNYEEE